MIKRDMFPAHQELVKIAEDIRKLPALNKATNNQSRDALIAEHNTLLELVEEQHRALQGYHRAAQKQNWPNNYELEYKAADTAIARVNKYMGEE